MLNRSEPILITYATATGSTVGVAEAIAKTLRKADLSVVVCPMAKVDDLRPYSAIVAGSGVQAKQWLPEALDFVREHRAVLATKPFAAFLVCMTMAMKNSDYRRVVPEFMQPVRDIVRPQFEGYFAGALDIKKIPYWQARLGFRISVMTGVWTEGDHRDWDAIEAWSHSLLQVWAPVTA
jgi:menaquinone-dependent protoporphyrinogen oxidase